MMRVFGRLLAKSIFTFALCLSSTCAMSATASVCIEPEPPPWVFHRLDEQGKRTDEIVGFSVDLVREIFRFAGYQVEFHFEYPWARCLVMVERGEIEFAMDAFRDPERELKFTFSQPYKSLNTRIFLRPRFKGILHQRADLRLLHGCGLIGASYSHIGIDPVLIERSIGFESLNRKLTAGRCDYVIVSSESAKGDRRFQEFIQQGSIEPVMIAGLGNPAYHLITSVHGPDVAKIPELNKAIALLIRNGTVERLWRRYTGKEFGNSMP